MSRRQSSQQPKISSKLSNRFSLCKLNYVHKKKWFENKLFFICHKYNAIRQDKDHRSSLQIDCRCKFISKTVQSCKFSALFLVVDEKTILWWQARSVFVWVCPHRQKRWLRVLCVGKPNLRPLVRWVNEFGRVTSHLWAMVVKSHWLIEPEAQLVTNLETLSNQQGTTLIIWGSHILI